MPEVTLGMARRALDYLAQLGEPLMTLARWIEVYYPSEEAQRATALGWMLGLSFTGMPKSPEYQAWREKWRL